VSLHSVSGGIPCAVPFGFVIWEVIRDSGPPHQADVPCVGGFCPAHVAALAYPSVHLIIRRTWRKTGETRTSWPSRRKVATLQDTVPRGLGLGRSKIRNAVNSREGRNGSVAHNAVGHVAGLKTACYGGVRRLIFSRCCRAARRPRGSSWQLGPVSVWQRGWQVALAAAKFAGLWILS